MMIRTTGLGLVLAGAVLGCGPELREEDRTPGQAAPAAEMQPPQLRDEGPDEHLLFRPDDVDWQPAPASLEEGADVAVLEGDPAAANVFTMRIRMPDGYHIAPHWHPNVERVTVLSGTFRLGSGDTLDRDAATPLQPGSYTSLPPETHHYAIADGETVIQLTSVGPWVINYVNAGDDPRARAR